MLKIMSGLADAKFGMVSAEQQLGTAVLADLGSVHGLSMHICWLPTVKTSQKDEQKQGTTRHFILKSFQIPQT